MSRIDFKSTLPLAALSREEACRSAELFLEAFNVAGDRNDWPADACTSIVAGGPVGGALLQAADRRDSGGAPGLASLESQQPQLM